MININKKVHCPQTIETIRKYMGKAEPFYTRKINLLDKQMKKQIAPLSKPYPKNDDWIKIDRTQFKKNKSLCQTTPKT